jgi:hypothetical protein
MKKIILRIVIINTVLVACNSASPDKKDSVNSATSTVPSNYSSAKTTVSIKEILDDYLQMKNAFAKDNDKSAAAAGDAMVKAFANFNSSTLTAGQSKIYTDIQDDAKEHAEHIGKNAGNIKHQREHFDMLSKDIYQLVKTLGGGGKLYYDHCPMYNDGKGADWLSETKEISNPYLGKSMPTCGSVKEEIK